MEIATTGCGFNCPSPAPTPWDVSAVGIGQWYHNYRSAPSSTLAFPILITHLCSEVLLTNEDHASRFPISAFPRAFTFLLPGHFSILDFQRFSVSASFQFSEFHLFAPITPSLRRLAPVPAQANSARPRFTRLQILPPSALARSAIFYLPSAMHIPRKIPTPQSRRPFVINL